MLLDKGLAGEDGATSTIRCGAALQLGQGTEYFRGIFNLLQGVNITELRVGVLGAIERGRLCIDTREMYGSLPSRFHLLFLFFSAPLQRRLPVAMVLFGNLGKMLLGSTVLLHVADTSVTKDLGSIAGVLVPATIISNDTVHVI